MEGREIQRRQEEKEDEHRGFLLRGETPSEALEERQVFLIHLPANRSARMNFLVTFYLYFFSHCHLLIHSATSVSSFDAREDRGHADLTGPVR